MTTDVASPHLLVAAEVRAALARERKTGRGAARELGWKSDYMHRRLDGRTAFDVNDLAAIALLLKVPVTSFFPDSILSRLSTTSGSDNAHYPDHALDLGLLPVDTVVSQERPSPADFPLAA